MTHRTAVRMKRVININHLAEYISHGKHLVSVGYIPHRTPSPGFTTLHSGTSRSHKVTKNHLPLRESVSLVSTSILCRAMDPRVRTAEADRAENPQEGQSPLHPDLMRLTPQGQCQSSALPGSRSQPPQKCAL